MKYRTLWDGVSVALILRFYPERVEAKRGSGAHGILKNAGPACNFESCLHSNLRYLKYKVAAPDHGSTIALVLFLCPSTGDRVQRWFADNGSEDGGEMGGEMYEGSDPL